MQNNLSFDEISLAKPSQTHNQVNCQSESDAHLLDQTTGDIFSQIQPEHLDSLKTALKSVYPFVPSINNSEYYFVHPQVISINQECIGNLVINTKTFSDKLVTDQSQAQSLAYEIELQLTHKCGLTIQPKFSCLSTQIQQGLLLNGISSALQVDQSQFKVSGTSTDSGIVKDIIKKHYSNQFKGQIYTVLFKLDIPGAWQYTFTIRGKIIATGMLYSVIGFNQSYLTKNNPVLKNNINKFIQKNQQIECLIPQVVCNLQEYKFTSEFEQITDDVTYDKQVCDPVQLSEVDEEFSYDQKQSKVEMVKQNFLNKLFKKDEDDDQLIFQTTKQVVWKIQPGQKHGKTNQKPKILTYTNKQIKDKAITMIGIQFTGGESQFLINSQEFKLGSKYFQSVLKLVITKQICDIYINSEFIQTLTPTDISFKLLEKGSQIELIDIDF